MKGFLLVEAFWKVIPSCVLTAHLFLAYIAFTTILISKLLIIKHIPCHLYDGVICSFSNSILLRGVWSRGLSCNAFIFQQFIKVFWQILTFIVHSKHLNLVLTLLLHKSISFCHVAWCQYHAMSNGCSFSWFFISWELIHPLGLVGWID